MNDHQPSDSAHGGPNPDGLLQVHRPYWKRAHYNRRFWAAAFIVFAAMIFYVMMVEFSLAPGHQSQQPIVSPAGR